MKSNVLLMGPVGTGKTTSLKTIATSGKKLFILATEPGIEAIMEDTDPEMVMWQFVPPAVVDWDTLTSNAKMLNTMTMEALQKANVNRSEYQQFMDLLAACANLKDERSGKEIGAMDELDDSWVVAIDGMSGLSKMAKDLVVGGKPVITRPEWGASMDNLERFVELCCSGTKCSFVLVSHIAREVNEVTGATIIVVDTLGAKLGPKIPRPFDEVVLTRREGTKFYWSTIDTSSEVKSRRLPLADNLTPDFAQIFKED